MVKLQIKTLSQKSLVIDIDDAKTVFDLKKELQMYPDVGVGPELQKLIYAGQVLTNDEQISSLNIDVKKFLVVMVLKQPQEEPVASSASSPAEAAQETKQTESKQAAETTTAARVPESSNPPPAATVATSDNEQLVANIVSMGYEEDDVRRALVASFYNPERAIEYLIEGIPDAAAEEADYTEGDADLTMSAMEMFRNDPLFRNLRRAIQQHPDMIDEAIARVGEANPAILSLINENQQEFLSMLMEGSEDDEDDDEDVEGGGI